MKNITLKKAYVLWVIVSIIGWIVSWNSGDLWNLMGQAVDFSNAVTPGVSRDQMIIGFIVISLIYWAIVVFASGLLVLFSSRQKAWAKYLLTLFCTYQACFEIYNSFETVRTYNYQFGIYDWILSAASLSMLLIVGILPHVKSTLKSS